MIIVIVLTTRSEHDIVDIEVKLSPLAVIKG
jgi:hypothetical protein